MTGEPRVYRHGPLALHGALWRPTGAGNGRAILVLHEADGLGDNVRRRCAMLAALGYTAFAADLHGEGRVLAGDAMMAAVARFRGDPALFRARVTAGLEALLAETGYAPAAVAAIGYCFGGSAALELARAGTRIAAVASFHGILTTIAPANAGDIRTRVLACTGARDPLVPLADVAAFSDEMAAAEADWQLIVYGRALHRFTNAAVAALADPRMAYDAEADAASWAACLRFLDASFA